MGYGSSSVSITNWNQAGYGVAPCCSMLQHGCNWSLNRRCLSFSFNNPVNHVNPVRKHPRMKCYAAISSISSAVRKGRIAMKEDEAGKVNNAFGRPVNQGFTCMELLVVISSIFILLLFILSLPTVPSSNRERVRRVDCLSNQYGMWKAASQWGLDSKEAWRPAFPNTNLAYAWAMDNAGVTPEILICPGAARMNNSWGITSATDLNAVRATNSNYAYFGGRTTNAGALVLIADKNGSNNLPSAMAWGGNHDGKGGNVTKVSGQGFWVSTPAESQGAQYCITNADVAAAFTNTGLVYLY